MPKIQNRSKSLSCKICEYFRTIILGFYYDSIDRNPVSSIDESKLLNFQTNLIFKQINGACDYGTYGAKT